MRLRVLTEAKVVGREMRVVVLRGKTGRKLLVRVGKELCLLLLEGKMVLRSSRVRAEEKTNMVSDKTSFMRKVEPKLSLQLLNDAV